MAERRELLEKRRLVRALDVFCGSLANKSVSVGTEKHPEMIDPFEPQVPELDVLLAYVLAFGTGRSVDPDEDGYDDLGVHTVEGLNALLRSMKDETLLFAPGESFAYSNMAFDMMGDVIAKVSGMPFEDYVKQAILEPLGMHTSSFIHAGACVRRAHTF